MSHVCLTLFVLAAGEVIEVGDFDPKLAAFWVDQGTPDCSPMALFVFSDESYLGEILRERSTDQMAFHVLLCSLFALTKHFCTCKASPAFTKPRKRYLFPTCPLFSRNL